MDATFREAAAEHRVVSVPLSHLSVEVGHLYMEDFQAGPDHLARQFRSAGRWLEAARAGAADAAGGRRPRVSTCFLVDDYFSRFASPARVVPMLLEVAAQAGLSLDYLARESACAQADGVALAGLVEARLVASPTPGTDGSRPPPAEVGWLSNGERSPSGAAAPAMSAAVGWRPPSENAARRHSVFLDVELWDERDGRRTWSCPFLAAVWQLLRLGLLRDLGDRVAVPRALPGDLPEDWDALPPVVQVNPRAAPFSAYRTWSVLDARFLPVEHAVRVILDQVAIDDEVTGQVLSRAAAEGLDVPRDVVDRIGYVFMDDR